MLFFFLVLLLALGDLPRHRSLDSLEATTTMPRGSMQGGGRMGGLEGSGGGLVHLEQMIGTTTLSAYDLNTLSELAADMADAEKLLSKATRPKVNTMLTEYLTQLSEEYNTRSANRGTPMPKQQKATETGAARGMIATPSPHRSWWWDCGRDGVQVKSLGRAHPAGLYTCNWPAHHSEADKLWNGRAMAYETLPRR